MLIIGGCKTPGLTFLLVFAQLTRGEIDQKNSVQYLENDSKSSLQPSVEGWTKECSKSYTSTCLKWDIVSLVEKLSDQKSLGILPGVSVVKQDNSKFSLPMTTDTMDSLARDYPNDMEKRMDAYLMYKIGAYLKSHAISIKLFDPRTFEATRSFNEATMKQLGFGQHGDNTPESARKKDKGGMGGLMAALMMMKGTLGALGFGALAMLAGKALMTGLMALMLAAIVGLKSMHHGEKKTTYEIISKPIHSVSHSHSLEEHHGGYGRSLDPTIETIHEAIKKYANVRDRRQIF